MAKTGQVIATTSLEDTVKQANKGCKLCENFATRACPSFQKIQAETGVDDDELSAEIKRQQAEAGQTLNPCSNDPNPS